MTINSFENRILIAFVILIIAIGAIAIWNSYLVEDIKSLQSEIKAMKSTLSNEKKIREILLLQHGFYIVEIDSNIYIFQYPSVLNSGGPLNRE